MYALPNAPAAPRAPLNNALSPPVTGTLANGLFGFDKPLIKAIDLLKPLLAILEILLWSSTFIVF